LPSALLRWQPGLRVGAGERFGDLGRRLLAAPGLEYGTT
jgi:hypothetical protein